MATLSASFRLLDSWEQRLVAECLVLVAGNTNQMTQDRGQPPSLYQAMSGQRGRMEKRAITKTRKCESTKKISHTRSPKLARGTEITEKNGVAQKCSEAPRMLNQASMFQHFLIPTASNGSPLKALLHRDFAR